MDSLFGMKGNGFTVVVADSAVRVSLMKVSNDTSKHYSLWGNISISYAGECSSAREVIAYAGEKIKFEHIRNNIPINASTTANIIQKSVYNSLRSHNPHNLSCIVVDKSNLLAIDSYGAMWEAEYACLGYAQYFLYGILDRNWKPEITLDEALNIAKLCIKALKEKFILGETLYSIRVVSEEGIKDVPIADVQ